MRISWGDTNDKVYQTGLDRGVFYDSARRGVPWNGLTSVDETKNVSVSPVYFDGDKVNDFYTTGASSAKLKAVTFPDEFLPYMGVLEVENTGLMMHDQPVRGRFHLSYRTMKIRADGEIGYEIHIWYNLSAIPSPVEQKTINTEAAWVEFEWDLSSVPVRSGAFAPTGHIVLDTTKMSPYLAMDLENLLYGTDTEDAVLPDLPTLNAYINRWRRMIITDNDDGTWTADAYFDTDIEIVGDTFTIYNANATYLDADTFEISSTEENREDLWQP
jgi:hypothetical protein